MQLLMKNSTEKFEKSTFLPCTYKQNEFKEDCSISDKAKCKPLKHLICTINCNKLSFNCNMPVCHCL